MKNYELSFLKQYLHLFPDVPAVDVVLNSDLRHVSLWTDSAAVLADWKQRLKAHGQPSNEYIREPSKSS